MGAVTWAALTQASSGDLVPLLAEAEATALVTAIRSATDAQIDALTQAPERGSAVLQGVTARIGDLAIPARLAGMQAVLGWETPDAGAVAVELRDGRATTTTGTPDVVVEGSVHQLLRLVAGQLDVAVAYLGDQIRFRGASDLAISLAALFAVDGTAPITGTPVDVRAIDPVDIARVLHDVPVDHLRSVLASDFRTVVLEEIFERMPSYVNRRKAAGVQITVGFRLTGRPDGEVDRYVLRLSDGHATVLTGEAADAVGSEDRHATVTCDAADFLRLVTGHLSAISGVLRGQLRVSGDKVSALRLNAAFDVPTAAAG